MEKLGSEHHMFTVTSTSIITTWPVLIAFLKKIVRFRPCIECSATIFFPFLNRSDGDNFLIRKILYPSFDTVQYYALIY